MWTPLLTPLNVMDRIRVINCYAKPGSKTPGTIYYNCQQLDLLQSCWDLDDNYLARQSTTGKFILTSRTVMSTPNKAKPEDGLFSKVVWPDDVSMMTKERGEIPFLHFRVQYAHWTAQQVQQDEEPPLSTFAIKLWPTHCEELLPGGSADLNTWKEIMQRGLNPIPFVVLVSLKTATTAWSNGDQELTVHAFRSGFANYVMGPSCPVVSRALVEANITKKSTPKNNNAIVNVSVTGLSKGVGGPFPTFRAVTSAPDELTNEEAIQDAIDLGSIGALVFFAVPDKDKTEGAPSDQKKQKRKI